jgi:hypothetical protein
MKEEQAPQTSPSGAKRLSSNTTLMWRVFAPVFGTVFLLGFTLAFWLIPEEDLYFRTISIQTIRAVSSIALLIWLWIVWRKLLPLKRLDADAEYIYLTNYWTTVRYPIHDIERIEVPGKRIAYLILKAPGRFGQKIAFLPTANLEEFRQKLV